MSQKTSNSKLSLHNLFYNNKFVLAFSIVAAFVIWIVITVTQAPVLDREIGNVSVTIDMGDSSQPKQLGLQPFGVGDTRVNVTVRGKRYEVNSLDEADIIVTADTSSVGSAGTHTLSLKATCENKDIEIVSISQRSIDAYFDAYKEQSFTLEKDIEAPNGLVPDGYTYNEPALSSQNIVISGPATEINRIQRVVASVKIDEPLTATPASPLVASVTPETASGDAPRYVTIKGGGEVTVSIQVLKIKELPTSISFTGAPSAYASAHLPYTVSPSTVRVAGNPDTIDSLGSLVVGTVDFSKIGENGGSFYFKASDISGYRVLDEVDTFTVRVTASSMGSTVLNLPAASIRLQNVPQGFQAQLAQQTLSGVTIVGTRQEIGTLSASDVTADVDLSSVAAAEGTYTVDVKISVAGKSTCWVYSTYSVTVSLTRA